MSIFGVPLKQPFQVLRSSDWNALVSAVDQLYMLNFYTQVGLFSGQLSPYFESLYTADGAFFGSEIYVEGYKVLHDLDPIYIAQFLQGAVNQIYNYISVYLINIQNTVQQIQSTVQNIKLYASPTALQSFVLPVTTTPTTLVSSSTPIKRALLFVTNDTTYVV